MGDRSVAANQLISAWTGISTGSLTININGAGSQNITGLNFATQTNLNGVAAVIQTALQAVATGGYTAATCVWNPSTQNFVITSGTTGTSSTVSFLTPEGAGVDITGMLAMLSSSAGAYQAAGIAAETAVAAVTIFDNLFGTQWYGLTIPSAVDADSEAVAPYIEADNPYHFFGVNTSASGVLTSGTSDVAYILQQAGYNKTSVVYSLNTYAIDSYLARILTTQWSLQNSAITLFGKTLPGITPETLNTTQVTNLEGKNANVYVSYNNGTAQVEQGVCCSGLYVDTVIGVDALRAQIATNLFNAIQTTPTKVPQTDAGEHTLATQIQAACDMFVNNGLIGPGTWNYQGFGQLQQGGYLSTGYYIYTPPVASQSQTSRLARQSVAFQVAAQMAGAVQSVNMTVTVSQ